MSDGDGEVTNPSVLLHGWGSPGIYRGGRLAVFDLSNGAGETYQNC